VIWLRIVKEAFGGIKLYYEDAKYYPNESIENAIIQYNLLGEPKVEGSENSWKYIPIRMDTQNSVNNLIIPIWGNLRDYGHDKQELQYIVDVVKDVISKLKQNGILVRGFVILVESELGFGLLCYGFYDKVYIIEVGE